jgi:hypothetical protein
MMTAFMMKGVPYNNCSSNNAANPDEDEAAQVEKARDE